VAINSATAASADLNILHSYIDILICRHY